MRDEEPFNIQDELKKRAVETPFCLAELRAVYDVIQSIELLDYVIQDALAADCRTISVPQAAEGLRKVIDRLNQNCNKIEI